MVDMGQADASLYRRSTVVQNRICWSKAVQLAAEAMGYEHYLDVPAIEDEELRQRARSIIGVTGD